MIPDKERNVASTIKILSLCTASFNRSSRVSSIVFLQLRPKFDRVKMLSELLTFPCLTVWFISVLVLINVKE